MKKRFLVLAILALCVTGLALASTVSLPADHYKDIFPDQYQSFLKNAENSEAYDYVLAHPQIAVLYEGSGFAYSYNSARGHEYSLEDVQNIGRPHPLANCLTCKSGDYTAMVNELGEGAYKLPFKDAFNALKGGISCFNCHGETPGQFEITHQYLKDAVGEDSGIKAATLACAQCHVEYYFPSDTKATVLPYQGHENATPEMIYAYYDHLGFADFINPRTGSRMIKVQHPEFETYTGAGSVHAGTFSCADCHMGKAVNDAGQTYSSHYLTSPVKNPAISDSCAQCHTDLDTFVKDIQEKTEARTYEIADQLVLLTNTLADKVAAGATDEELNEVRALNREAQFYWDFVFVENSEGAHNRKLTDACLTKAEQLTAKALDLIRQ